MKDKILQKIISYFREEMATSSTTNAPGFSNAANAGGPVAGYDAPLKNKKRYIYGKGYRKLWSKGAK